LNSTLSLRAVKRQLEKALGWREGFLDTTEQKEKRAQIHQFVEGEAIHILQTQTSPSSSSSIERLNIVRPSSQRKNIHVPPKRKSPSTRKTVDSPERRIQKLKMYISLCGVRRVWSKELANLPTSAAISKLEEILHELGIEGRPSKSKCAEIRKIRENTAELAELDPSNILTSRTRCNEAKSRTNPSGPIGSTTSHHMKVDPLVDLSEYGDPNANED
jgi:hypothetical protein